MLSKTAFFLTFVTKILAKITPQPFLFYPCVSGTFSVTLRTQNETTANILRVPQDGYCDYQYWSYDQQGLIYKTKN